MLSDEDVQKMLTVFATKQDIKELKEELTEKMATKEEQNRVYNLVDKVLGEVKSMRMEQAANYQRDQDLEVRVEKIERIPVIAHELKRPKD